MPDRGGSRRRTAMLVNVTRRSLMTCCAGDASRSENVPASSVGASRALSGTLAVSASSSCTWRLRSVTSVWPTNVARARTTISPWPAQPGPMRRHWRTLPQRAVLALEGCAVRLGCRDLSQAARGEREKRGRKEGEKKERRETREKTKEREISNNYKLIKGKYPKWIKSPED